MKTTTSCTTTISCTTTTSYTTTTRCTTTSEKACKGILVDMVIILDSSGSVCEGEPLPCANWKLMIDFVATLVSKMDIDEGNARIAVIIFSTEAEIQFTLDW